MKTIIKCLILLIHLIGFIQCQRLSKDDDSTRRQDVAPRHQEYDKKMLEALLKEVISDELSKMKSSFDQPKDELKKRDKERTLKVEPMSNSKDEPDPMSSLIEENVRLEKLRRKLEQEVTRRERLREERDREERLREEKTRRELKRLEKLLAEAKNKLKDSSKMTSSSDHDRERERERESDPLKLFNLKELDMLTDEAKLTESGEQDWPSPDLMKQYMNMDMNQQVFDFPMMPTNDRPQFLPQEPKPSPAHPQFLQAPSSSEFMPNYARHFNHHPNIHPPSFGGRAPPPPRHNPMHMGPPPRPPFSAFSPSMSRFPSPPPPPHRPMPFPRIGTGQSLTSLASSMYPSVYGSMKKSRSEEKEEKRPSKKIKSAIKDFAVSSIIDVGMMSIMNNLLGKINAEPGTGRRYFL